jgi:L-ascorbate metabolism protein UlaG (beta-lactamase superfamily)
MHARWFGQSAFLLEGAEGTVMIDPFGSLDALRGRVQFDYPAIDGVTADLVLVTHDHADHNAVEVVDGDPVVVRAAGTHATPIGEVVGVAGEHDAAAGTQRGPNTLFAFWLDGLRVAHLGDHGQRELRTEQREALGDIDVLFLPVGGGPTIDAAGAAEIVEQLAPRWVVPMHYRTDAVDFLAPAEPFLERFETVTQIDSSEVDVDRHPEGVVVPSAPPPLR